MISRFHDIQWDTTCVRRENILLMKFFASYAPVHSRQEAMSHPKKVWRRWSNHERWTTTRLLGSGSYRIDPTRNWIGDLASELGCGNQANDDRKDATFRFMRITTKENASTKRNRTMSPDRPRTNWLLRLDGHRLKSFQWSSIVYWGF